MNMKGELRSSSSCAACKFLKRKCSPTCIFAPYFRADESRKFARVHKVFGASNVSKILAEVPELQRADTVNSLAYEAELRLRDPVYGCIGAIAILQNQMLQLQHDLAIARARLALYTHYLPPPLPLPPPPDPLPDYLMLDQETTTDSRVRFDRNSSSEFQCHGPLHLLQ
ncbi:LOB domain-containing protein 21-like [Macadamia integrifolia]|uniref:LOB domain-containing protein 21-like n=1 Tax=Macadamia integrifolia TaxID=60698 RepID=UPI001C4ED5C0|nr:LOB domain-containing protein 21-like [Macadamia integrifolia]